VTDAFWPLQDNAPLSSATPYSLFLIREYSDVPMTHQCQHTMQKIVSLSFVSVKEPLANSLSDLFLIMGQVVEPTSHRLC